MFLSGTRRTGDMKRWAYLNAFTHVIDDLHLGLTFTHVRIGPKAKDAKTLWLLLCHCPYKAPCAASCYYECFPLSIVDCGSQDGKKYITANIEGKHVFFTRSSLETMRYDKQQLTWRDRLFARLPNAELPQALRNNVSAYLSKKYKWGFSYYLYGFRTALPYAMVRAALKPSATVRLFTKAPAHRTDVSGSLGKLKTYRISVRHKKALTIETVKKILKKHHLNGKVFPIAYDLSQRSRSFSALSSAA